MKKLSLALLAICLSGLVGLPAAARTTQPKHPQPGVSLIMPPSETR